jgi:uncharacterized protein (DUF58 family)
MSGRPFVHIGFMFSDKIAVGMLPLLLFTAFFSSNKIVIGCFLIYYMFVLLINLYVRLIPDYIHILQESRTVRVFPGQQATFKVGIINASRLVITKAKLTFHLHKSIQMVKEKDTGEKLTNSETISFTMMPKKQIQWKFTIIPQNRGIFYPEKLDLIVHDWSSTATMFFPSVPRLQTEILVYPEMKPIKNITMLQQVVNGDKPTNFSFFHDESSVIGIKPYEGESFRKIHWKASLRTGGLMAKKYDPVTHNGITICLVLNEGKQFFHSYTEDLISYTAYLCKYCITNKIPYELFINQIYDRRPVTLQMNGGNSHLLQSLTRMAKLNQFGLMMNETPFYQYVAANKAASILTVCIGGSNASGGLLQNPVMVNYSGELVRGHTHAAASI